MATKHIYFDQDEIQVFQRITQELECSDSYLIRYCFRAWAGLPVSSRFGLELAKLAKSLRVERDQAGREASAL